MNKILLKITMVLILVGCGNPPAVGYQVNAYLEKESLIWPSGETAGDITVIGLFKEQAEVEKKKDGDWYRYLYKVTYQAVKVKNGSWNDPEISFLYRDTWPTKESGIEVKKLACPFRANEYMIFEIKKEGGKNRIIGYEQIDEGHVHGPAELDTARAADIAENFMRMQPDAGQYKLFATGVRQEEIGVYIVGFIPRDPLLRKEALVEVVLKDNICRRIR